MTLALNQTRAGNESVVTHLRLPIVDVNYQKTVDYQPPPNFNLRASVWLMKGI